MEEPNCPSQVVSMENMGLKPMKHMNLDLEKINIRNGDMKMNMKIN